MSENIDKNILAKLIQQHFNLSELRELCFSLKIKYEWIPGNTIIDKSIELIEYMDRRDELSALVKELMQVRPKISWPKHDEPQNDELTQIDIHCIIFALTRREIEDLIKNVDYEIQNRQETLDKNSLSVFYGENRCDWVPFVTGLNNTIGEILKNEVSLINNLLLQAESNERVYERPVRQ